MKSTLLRQFMSGCFRSLLLSVIFGVCFLLVAPMGRAQSTGGRIRGTVIDPSGGAVAGAKVMLVNEATGTTREAQTSANGEYLFLEVPVGSYEIDVTGTGFKKYARKGIVLVLNEIASVDISLQVGGSTETVEVTGARRPRAHPRGGSRLREVDRRHAAEVVALAVAREVALV